MKKPNMILIEFQVELRMVEEHHTCVVRKEQLEHPYDIQKVKPEGYQFKKKKKKKKEKVL